MGNLSPPLSHSVVTVAEGLLPAVHPVPLSPAPMGDPGPCSARSNLASMGSSIGGGFGHCVPRPSLEPAFPEIEAPALPGRGLAGVPCTAGALELPSQAPSPPRERRFRTKRRASSHRCCLS